MSERLDKIIASQMKISRKQARISIFKGEVRVDGKQEIDPSAKVDPQHSDIEYNGRRINYNKHFYIMMNKPAGVLSVSSDDRQKTAVDILDEVHYRKGLYPAGRLDKDSVGLLILTDDGDFCHRVISPKSDIYKTYYVELDKAAPENAEELFKQGVELEQGIRCRPAYYTSAAPQSDEHHTAGQFAAVVKICEGKYHQVKRMFEALGVKVTYLKRVSVGSLLLDGSLQPGQCRFLTDEDIKNIFVNESK